MRGFGPDNDITVDAGAYRTWPEYTPTTHALITEYLGLSVECYEDEIPCEKYNIVDPDTKQKIGFATFVEEMMTRLTNDGVCFYTRHELISLEKKDDGSTILSFSNGVMATALNDVVLNVPQRPLLKILRKSSIPGLEMSNVKEIYDALHSVQTEIATKLYLYYSDAWWYKLGLTNGEFEMEGDARNMLLKGRYHDGHVKCDDDGENCHGFLLAVYAHDHSGNKAQYFRRYQRDRPEPVTVISNTDVEGESFLQEAHDRLQEYHVYHNTSPNRTYTGFQATRTFERASPPEYAVLATWNTGTFGAGGAWHHWTDVENVELAKKPLNKQHVHIINEAYSMLQGWAEGSLLLADEVLEEEFGVVRPWDFEAPDYVQFVAQTDSQECAAVEDDEGSSGSGSNGGGGGGGGGGDGTVDLCFTENALVTMADGSMRVISSMEKGDVVSTGMGTSTGRVTEVLVHRAKKAIDVTIVTTPLGELVGTSSHPVFMDGIWMEMEQAMDDGSFDRHHYHGAKARKEIRYVEVMYNLEVDGDSPGSSSHSYVVNGIVASGLGDNLVLNRMFARQSSWKDDSELSAPMSNTM